MAKVITRIGTRCAEHPHRPAVRLCARCARPVCAECLAPGERRADGTRGWFCRPCAAVVRGEALAAARARTAGACSRRRRCWRRWSP